MKKCLYILLLLIFCGCGVVKKNCDGSGKGILINGLYKGSYLGGDTIVTNEIIMGELDMKVNLSPINKCKKVEIKVTVADETGEPLKNATCYLVEENGDTFLLKKKLKKTDSKGIAWLVFSRGKDVLLAVTYLSYKADVYDIKVLPLKK